MSNAAAGDIVLFMDGTYDAPTSPTYRDLVWNPSNSGTSGNPITFKALNRHQAIIKGTGSEDGSGAYAQPVIGAIGRNYITWDGFYLYARNSSDTANIFVTARIDGSTGCSVINNTFEAGTHSSGGATNNAGVFLQAANYLTIENNTFFGFREASNNENNAAILGYPSSYVTIKNNTIYNSTGGINLKDRISYATVENNFISNCFRAIYAPNANGGSSTDLTIHNNVLANNTRSAIVTGNDGVINNQIISNNTIYLSSSPTYDYGDIELKNTGISTSGYPKIYNNIVYRGWGSLVTNGTANMLAECDHNQYSTNLRIVVHKYVAGETTYTSLSAWQSSGELYGGGNPGAGSLNSDPLFVNSSGDMDELADFALQGGSPCLGAGRDSSDMGADVSLVGVDAGVEDTTPPVRSNGSPSGTIEYTATVTLSLNTNETATCKWDTSSGTAYASMDNTFTNTNSTSHSHASVAVSEGANIFYVRCEDGSDNENTDDYSISFTVEEGTPPPSPVTNFNILSTGASTIGGG
ncbi:MAG: right-handed parallel beta-helix repeat-containing protein, partial [Dehalococcoidales bacterium]|nr:right-handed parallel beta-helix repeat-containing protein [Dehalococcoidales bacterium]